jgi:hypothetical protein
MRFDRDTYNDFFVTGIMMQRTCGPHLYHIRFTRGDLEGQLAIGALIGKLQIEILPLTE